MAETVGGRQRIDDLLRAKGLDKVHWLDYWGVWSSQTHGRPASRWNPLQRESVESDPSVVIIPDLNSPTSAEVCLHSVLQGQRVLRSFTLVIPFRPFCVSELGDKLATRSPNRLTC